MCLNIKEQLWGKKKKKKGRKIKGSYGLLSDEPCHVPMWEYEGCTWGGKLSVKVEGTGNSYKRRF